MHTCAVAFLKFSLIQWTHLQNDSQCAARRCRHARDDATNMTCCAKSDACFDPRIRARRAAIILHIRACIGTGRRSTRKVCTLAVYSTENHPERPALRPATSLSYKQQSGNHHERVQTGHCCFGRRAVRCSGRQQSAPLQIASTPGRGDVPRSDEVP